LRRHSPNFVWRCRGSLHGVFAFQGLGLLALTTFVAFDLFQPVSRT
jgi:hypothetical protein